MSGAQPAADQRGMSPVAGTAKPLVSRKVLAVGIGAIMLATGGFAVWRFGHPPEKPVKEKLPPALGDVVTYHAPVMVLPPAPKPAPVPSPAPVVHPERTLPPPEPHLLMPRQDPVVQGVAPPPAFHPYMMSFDPGPATAPDPRDGPGQRDTAGADGPDGTRGASSVTYASSHLDGMKAGLLGDQTFMLSPGLMPCALDTAVDSTFPGPIECHVPFDIKPHGVTLIDRGSVVHGDYANDVRAGQGRLFVAADWIEDKATGCEVKFDNTQSGAPMADSVGTAGVQGNVDPHTWERLGAAMMLTLGASGENLAQAALSKSGNTYLSFNGTGGGLDQMANAMLQRSMNIPPTITLQQGQVISVFIKKPLDFSPCYGLRIKDQ